MDVELEVNEDTATITTNLTPDTLSPLVRILTRATGVQWRVLAAPARREIAVALEAQVYCDEGGWVLRYTDPHGVQHSYGFADSAPPDASLTELRDALVHEFPDFAAKARVFRGEQLLGYLTLRGDGK